MSNYLWMIDAGHGGVDRHGKYTTAPAKMHTFEDGFTVYEGLVNRSIAKMVYTQLFHKDIDFNLVYDEVDDTTLVNRIHVINVIQSRRKNCISLSIHSNAGGGSGFEIFTSPGQDKSDVIAESLCKFYQSEFPDFKFRADKSDGDLDKEDKLAMVGGNPRVPLTCPSVLVENLFFDNRKEAELLVKPEFQIRIANTIVKWIEHVEKTKPV